MIKNPLKYTCLFGGGAIRGIAHVGALRAMERLGIETDTCAGSSVGSIVAALVGVGYNADEIEDIFLKVNFTSIVPAGNLCYSEDSQRALAEQKRSTEQKRNTVPAGMKEGAAFIRTPDEEDFICRQAK